MANSTHRPDIDPTSTQVKISQRVCPSPEVAAVVVESVEFEEVKKSVSHFVVAVLCLVAEMIIHAAATANPARVTKTWIVV